MRSLSFRGDHVPLLIDHCLCRRVMSLDDTCAENRRCLCLLHREFAQVVLRSGGCIRIGWALPACCPSSRNVGVGEDEFSWACDGFRAMKWHGTTSPTSSPYDHGVPYGNDWRSRSGDVIGCAVDLDAGVMSFR